MLIFMFLDVDDYMLFLVSNKCLLKEFIGLCLSVFSLLENVSVFPDPHMGSLSR